MSDAAVRGQFGRVAAIARRDLTIERSYRLRILVFVARAVVLLMIMYHVSKLVVDSPELRPYGGSYFDFVVVGLAIMSVAGVGIRAFNQNILREQSLGTLEVLLATPTPVSVLLSGSFVFPLAMTMVELVLYLGLGLAVIGGGFGFTGLLLAIPVIVLLLGSFCAFGIVGAAIVVLIKRGDPLTAPVTMATSILSGALFPVSTLPRALELAAHAFPAYYGINGTRDALLASGGWSAVAPDIAALLAFDAVLLPVSIWVFRRALAAARRAGTLANY